MKKINIVIAIMSLPTVMFLSSCGKNDNPVMPSTTASIQIGTYSVSDSLSIEGSNVVLYNANNGEAVGRAFTDANGVCKFNNVNPGNYFVKISAQNFKELPQRDITPVPFSVKEGDESIISYYLDSNPGTWGKIDGRVMPQLAGFLVVARSTTDNAQHFTYTGPDGYFVIFNVPFGDYDVTAIKSAYAAIDTPSVSISQSFSTKTVEIGVNQITGSSLIGSVTFLATENGIVDISILDKNTHAVINGLTTKIDSNKNFRINNIPEGQYIAWASYKNDSYVMDPDWIFKNPGGLEVTFLSDTIKSLNFSVTGAIPLISPTNPPDSVIPVITDTDTPTFNWAAYPSAKEYIIEVKDINGNIVWGGFNADGKVNHAQISKDKTSIKFNFDGSAKSPLVSGKIYQWKVYADNDAALNVQTLISSSEDLVGLFKVP